MKKNSYDDFDRVLKLALIGEERAKAQLVRMLDPLIISSIKRYCPIFNEYEDLHQDGKAIVLECIEHFNKKYSFLSYVKSNLKFFYLDTYKYLKDVQSDIRDDIDNDCDVSIFDSIASDVDIESDFLESEKLDLLRDGLDRLTDRQRQVIVLFFYERLGLSEIADYLGISKWTVVNLKRNAINSLREFLSKRS